MDPVHGNSSSKHKDDEQGHPTLGNKPERERESRNSSSSSSDGESSEEDFFEVDATELNKSFVERNEISSDKLASQSMTQNGQVTGIYGVGNPTDDNLGMFGPTNSPPVQVMERSDVPDPNRIPSSVFTRTKSTAPVEWSVASNESLFSIHTGNSSFSNFSSSPMDPYSPISPGVFSPVGINGGQELELPSAAEATNAAAMQDVSRENAEKVGSKDQHPAGDMHHFASISDRSESSMASIQSFAFPVLTDGRSRSVKEGPVHQPQHLEPAQQSPPQTETPKVAPAVEETKWFPCFTCPFCC